VQRDPPLNQFESATQAGAGSFLVKGALDTERLARWLRNAAPWRLADNHVPSATCLPKDIKHSDVVSTKIIESGNGEVVEKLTVEQKLNELKAYCKNGTLVDGAGRQVAFHSLTGCWGNPPSNYQEILEQNRAQLEKLRTRYTSIEMTCNPTGLRIP
jgi:hypothetical protein